jgi:hypothetical protein
MAQQGKPGWYDDGTGQQRWWDGRGWTGYTQPDSSTAAPLPTPRPVAPVPAAPQGDMAPELPAKRVPSRRRGVSVLATAGLTGGALLLGLIFGGAIGGAANDNSGETTKLTAAVAGLQTKLRSATTERDTLKSAAATVSAQADRLSEQKTALEDETAQLAKRASKLDAREKKVAARESVVKREAAAAAASSSESSSSGDSSDTGSSSYAPDGATAQCNDGTYSYSAHRSGTCSHHGGVGTWL